MKNFVQPGESLTLTAPVGGVTSGNGYQIGQLFVVAAATVAAGLPFVGAVLGVVTLPKTAAQVFAEGALVYWDNTAKSVTTVATGNLRIGAAAAAAAGGDATALVRLNGMAAPAGA